MRNDARPAGEQSQRELDPAHQEQAVERSPAGESRPGSSVVDEHARSSNTQHAGGLTGGDPEGAPRRTPERARTERHEQGGRPDDTGSGDAAMPSDDATLRTEI